MIATRLAIRALVAALTAISVWSRPCGHGITALAVHELCQSDYPTPFVACNDSAGGRTLVTRGRSVFTMYKTGSPPFKLKDETDGAYKEFRKHLRKAVRLRTKAWSTPDDSELENQRIFSEGVARNMVTDTSLQDRAAIRNAEIWLLDKGTRERGAVEAMLLSLQREDKPPFSTDKLTDSQYLELRKALLTAGHARRKVRELTPSSSRSILDSMTGYFLGRPLPNSLSTHGRKSELEIYSKRLAQAEKVEREMVGTSLVDMVKGEIWVLECEIDLSESQTQDLKFLEDLLPTLGPTLPPRLALDHSGSLGSVHGIGQMNLPRQ